MKSKKPRAPKDCRSVEIFTTGEVGRICGVAARTVTKWTDSGLLPFYVVPGSKDRRITRSSLVRFMEERGIPFTSNSLFAFPDLISRSR